MRNTLTAIAASLLLALPAVAEEAHHPDQKTDAVPTAQAPAMPTAKPTAAVQPVQQIEKRMDIIQVTMEQRNKTPSAPAPAK